MSRYLFTNRQGGVSDTPYNERNLALHVGDDREKVLLNRAALASELELPVTDLFFMNQSHGCEIIEIDHASVASDIRECDAMFTRTPGKALAVLTADCAPVLLFGERTSAVVHVGWRGLFGGILERVLQVMANEKFSALIGPTICGKCYEIGNDLFAQASEKGFIVGKQSLDIPRSIISELEKNSGKKITEISWSGECTMERDDYYSFRREQITGRQAGVIVHGS